MSGSLSGCHYFDEMAAIRFQSMKGAGTEIQYCLNGEATAMSMSVAEAALSHTVWHVEARPNKESYRMAPQVPFWSETPKRQHFQPKALFGEKTSPNLGKAVTFLQITL